MYNEYLIISHSDCPDTFQGDQLFQCTLIMSLNIFNKLHPVPRMWTIILTSDCNPLNVFDVLVIWCPLISRRDQLYINFLQWRITCLSNKISFLLHNFLTSIYTLSESFIFYLCIAAVCSSVCTCTANVILQINFFHGDLSFCYGKSLSFSGSCHLIIRSPPPPYAAFRLAHHHRWCSPGSNINKIGRELSIFRKEWNVLTLAHSSM